MSLKEPQSKQKERIRRKSLFARNLTAQGGSSVKLETNVLAGSGTNIYELYENCDKLPLTVFVDCYLTHDYNKLVISGLVSEKSLTEHWNKIYQEYCELIGDASALGTLYQIIEINTLNSRITRIKTFVGMLQMHPHPILIDLLVKEGIVMNETELEESLQRALNLLCQDELRVSQLQASLEEQQGDKGDGEKITAAYFDDVLLSYGDVFKTWVPKKELSTQQYCRMVKKLKEHIASHNNNTSVY